MTLFLNILKTLRHPEEARSVVSKDARRAYLADARRFP